MIKLIKKIERNAKCPCGSGRKYKHCCLNSTSHPSTKEKSTEITSLGTEFAKYNKRDLLLALGELQTLPENHTQLLRLELAVRIVCLNKISGSKRIDIKQTVDLLNSHLSCDGSIGRLEDPAEKLFTENVVFFGGNYTIYPGETDCGAFLLGCLLRCFNNGDEFPEAFLREGHKLILTILKISNDIALRKGHQSPLKSQEDRYGKKIYYSGSEENVNAILFQKDDLKKELNININDLKQLVIDTNDERLIEDDPRHNILLIKPIININSEFIVAIPGALTFALRNGIFELAHKYEIFHEFIWALNNIHWAYIIYNMRFLSAEQISLSLPPLESYFPFHEALFRIDSDKIAYVQHIYDDGKNYDLDIPSGIWETSGFSNKLMNRNQQVVDYLTQGDKPHCEKVLIISVLSSIGRYGSIHLKTLFDNAKIVVMQVDELDVIIHLRICDDLTLWKYANVYKQFSFTPGLLFLDKFTFYLDNHHTFYMGDGFPPHQVMLPFGYGIDSRYKSAIIRDYHCAYTNEGKILVEVMRVEDDVSIPIYMKEDPNPNAMEMLIEGYNQPIWIEPNQNIIKYDNDIREMLKDFTSMLAYWIWQITPSLVGHLEILGNQPILIRYCLENLESWLETELDDQVIDVTALEIEYSLNNKLIELTIPEKILQLTSTKDNTGERIIVNDILKAINDLLKNEGHIPTLNETVINDILNKHVPLGMKKKLLRINPQKDPALYSINIPKLRYLQKHDIEYQLDGLVEEIKDNKLPIGEIEDITKKKELLHEIVNIFLHRLRSEITKYNWDDLITKLIASLESLWQYRATLSYTMSTQIECYGDNPENIKYFANTTQKIDKTTLTIRTLIEFIVAEPCSGSVFISQDHIDRLLAITYHLINWGMICDDIHFGLHDHNVSILKSGRIGIGNRESFFNVKNKFWLSKTQERIAESYNYFNEYYTDEDDNIHINSEVKEKFDLALKSEYGLTSDQIFYFLNYVMDLGFLQNVSAPSMKLSTLKLKCKTELKWSIEEVDLAIELFSLTSRESWDTAPPGYDVARDIAPWRYNRKLSYLRKPIIMKTVSGEETLVYWGPRHVIKAYENFTENILSGRLNTEDCKSSEMKKLLGDILSAKGKRFTKKVTNWFNDNSNFYVDSEVKISPKSVLNSSKDLGDIDVLCIDRRKNIVYSIECKKVILGRNSREMKTEMEKFIGKSKESKSWISKHQKRHRWLDKNRKMFAINYKIKDYNYKLFSLFVISEEIILKHMENLPMKIISFTELKREGIKKLKIF